MPKITKINRNTTETNITISLNLYGKGTYKVKTGIAFLDHMLSLFAKHGLFDLEVSARGDLDVDIHHTNEDVAITLGEAFSEALGNRAGIKRFGEAIVPMDEALVRVVVDISGRPYLDFPGFGTSDSGKEKYSLNDAQQFFKAFTDKAGITLHIDTIKGNDLHHVLEAVFKGFSKALMRAVEKEPRSKKSIPSTKGRI